MVRHGAWADAEDLTSLRGRAAEALDAVEGLGELGDRARTAAPRLSEWRDGPLRVRTDGFEDEVVEDDEGIRRACSAALTLITG